MTCLPNPPPPTDADRPRMQSSPIGRPVLLLAPSSTQLAAATPCYPRTPHLFTPPPPKVLTAGAHSLCSSPLKNTVISPSLASWCRMLSTYLQARTGKRTWGVRPWVCGSAEQVSTPPCCSAGWLESNSCTGLLQSWCGVMGLWSGKRPLAAPNRDPAARLVPGAPARRAWTHQIARRGQGLGAWAPRPVRCHLPYAIGAAQPRGLDHEAPLPPGQAAVKVIQEGAHEVLRGSAGGVTTPKPCRLAAGPGARAPRPASKPRRLEAGARPSWPRPPHPPGSAPPPSACAATALRAPPSAACQILPASCNNCVGRETRRERNSAL